MGRRTPDRQSPQTRNRLGSCGTGLEGLRRPVERCEKRRIRRRALQERSHAKSNDAYDDHGQDVWPGHFDPLPEGRSLVEGSITMCGTAVSSFLSPIVVGHDGAARMLLSVSADGFGGVHLCWGCAEIEEAHDRYG